VSELISQEASTGVA
ncbi:hypothetical protein, partial [Xanthomonas oryzae]